MKVVREMNDSLINPEAAKEGGDQADVGQADATMDLSEGAKDQTFEADPNAEDKLFAGKFKSAEELEKGYKEAVQKLTEKTPSAPESYEFDFSGHDVLKDFEIDFSTDPEWQDVAPAFKEANITQDQAYTNI